MDVSLSNPTGAGGGIIADDTGVGLIQDDDQLPADTDDRFYASEIDASFYTPSAEERAEVLGVTPNLQLESADKAAFLTSPTAAEV